VSRFWEQLAANAGGWDARRREAFVKMERPVELAVAIVDAIRASRERARLGLGGLDVTGGEVVVGLLFAAARVAKLRGVGREHFVSVAGSLHDLNPSRTELEEELAGAGTRSRAPSGLATGCGNVAQHVP
jgi:hypothetical protein